jgi:hypothetical protein
MASSPSQILHPDLPTVLGILRTLRVAVATFLQGCQAGCGTHVPGGWKLVRGCLERLQGRSRSEGVGLKNYPKHQKERETFTYRI